jgi:hypothetical protein
MVHYLDSLVALMDLRQRDLLSQVLFVMVTETLSRIMIATVDRGLLFGFSVGLRNNKELLASRLLFAKLL